MFEEEGPHLLAGKSRTPTQTLNQSPASVGVHDFHAIILAVLTVKWWQVMPAILFVSYLCYGPARPWISRRLRRELEEEDEEREREEAIEEGRQGSPQAATEETPSPQPDLTTEDRDHARRSV